MPAVSNSTTRLVAAKIRDNLNTIRRFSRKLSLRKAATASAAAAIVLLSLSGPAPSHATPKDQSVGKLMIVDCLLPGKVRRLGGRVTYLTPRRPVQTTGGDCEIRGGEYTSYDRADYATALKIWLPQAKAGDPKAQTYVGEIFEKGLGTQPDYAAAVSWYQKAADQGFARAEIDLGGLYERGLGVPQDMRKALNWYRRASGLEGNDLQFASSVRVTMQAKEQKIQQLQERSQRSEKEAAELRRQLQQAQSELNSRKDELKDTRDKLDQIRRQLQQQNEAINSKTESGLAKRQTALDQEESKLQVQRQQLTKLKAALFEQAQALPAVDREAAEQNNRLQNRLLKESAEAQRLRDRLVQVNQELDKSRASLNEGQDASATLLAQLQAAETERNSLNDELKDRGGQIQDLKDKLDTTKGSLDQAAARYADAMSDLERRRTLHEVELQRVKADRDRLAEERDALAKQSAADVEHIKQLRAKLEKQEAEYKDKLEAMEKEFATSQAKLKQAQDQMAAAESNQPSASTVASADPPAIELIEPPVTLTRGGGYAADVQSDIKTRDVVGKITAPAGIEIFTVNAHPQGVNKNGLFNIKVPMKGSQTPVSLVVVDKAGRRVSLDFNLLRPAGGEKSGAATQESTNNSGDKKFPHIYGLGDYYALVIGNSDYKHFPKLRTPVNDAQAVAKVLKQQYGYQTTLITDADAHTILTKLNDYRKTLNEKDNLLIYYAGHGLVDDSTGTAYWLPVDAEKDNDANWIPTRRITDYLSAMTAKQVLIVADSCYAGALTRSALSRLQSGKTVDEWVKWFKKMAKLRTRMLLSSGGNEPVNDGGGGDHSLFAKAFLEALRQNHRALDGYRLYLSVSKLVQSSLEKQHLAVDQTPEYAPIKFAGHEAGDFIFQPG